MVGVSAPEARFGWKTAITDALLAALVALALAFPILGLQTVEIGGITTVRTRFEWVAIAVSAVFAGRLLLRLLWTRRRRPPLTAPSTVAIPLIATLRRRARTLTAIALVLALAHPFLPFASRYTVSVATFIMIYVVLGWGLNVVVGLAGLLDLGYVAFYAVGAYTTALLTVSPELGLTFWQALPIAALLAAAFGFLLGFPVLRLRGDYLAIVTLGFGEIIHTVLQNWVSLTGGPAGIRDAPGPTFLGLTFMNRPPLGVTSFHQFFHIDFSPSQRLNFIYYLVLVLVLVVNWLTLRLRRLPIGRAWEALREDEIACRTLGINPTMVKLSAFTIGALLAGLAGAFFVGKQGFVSPESFTFIESATILAIVVLGGMGSQLGVLLAAILVGVLQELRVFAEYRMLFFGAAMIAIMVWRPRGLLAHRAPSVLLGGERRPV